MRRVLLVLAVCVTGVTASAQFRNPIKRLPRLESVPGLGRLLENPPLTTTGDDAFREAPTLDTFTPTAPVVRSILVNAANHPEILQRDIQVLLWGLLARVKVTDLNPHLQSIAARLLTPQELKIGQPVCVGPARDQRRATRDSRAAAAGAADAPARKRRPQCRPGRQLRLPAARAARHDTDPGRRDAAGPPHPERTMDAPARSNSASRSAGVEASGPWARQL